ncbi:hypothetical protein [Aliivibrio kagoshimensis]|uniref:hypothetical protein n=1 Tax=Aliivibrio kagoshimensis TaxID=2910230 RepID=UPI003D1201E6
MTDINVEANEALTQARNVLNQSEVNLEKSRVMNDLLLSQNRKLMQAFINLLPQENRFDLAVEGDALEQLEHDNEFMLEAMRQRDVYDIVHAINVLAMANTDVIHIATDFAAHINWFHVRVSPTTTDYLDKNRPEDRLLRECVDMGEEEALEKLLLIESKITELIIDARDEADKKAEVAA